MPPRDEVSDQAERPQEPEYRAAQRAKVLLILDDGQQQWVGCWARLDGPWLHFLDDEDNRWVTYPPQHVRCVEWAHPVIEDDFSEARRG